MQINRYILSCFSSSNTARFAGGTELSKTYREIITDDYSKTNSDSEEKQEQQAQDIINSMKSKLGKINKKGG
jgi:hypothetical protein